MELPSVIASALPMAPLLWKNRKAAAQLPAWKTNSWERKKSGPSVEKQEPAVESGDSDGVGHLGLGRASAARSVR